MIATLIGFLFFIAMAMALGTIAGMTSAYRDKAMAALRMEHVPAATLRRETALTYSPARQPRFAAADPLHARVARRRSARAA